MGEDRPDQTAEEGGPCETDESSGATCRHPGPARPCSGLGPGRSRRRRRRSRKEPVRWPLPAATGRRSGRSRARGAATFADQAARRRADPRRAARDRDPSGADLDLEPRGGRPARRPRSVLALPSVAPLTEVPLFGTLELAAGDDEGPPDGLTFDQALDLLLRNNLDLLARRFEIPAAQADVLTASLRANPIFYADSQLVPYGNFNPNTRPGGQTQYDVNISYPIDFSGKRKARTTVAVQAKRAVEAQYQDAVRLQIANLATAYVSVLAARETARYAATGLKGLDDVLGATRAADHRGTAPAPTSRGSPPSARRPPWACSTPRRRSSAPSGPWAASSTSARSRPRALELRASLRDDAPPPPAATNSSRLALRCRPDVVAYRIGVNVANAALKLQKANRYADAYVLLQPYTFQNNSPTRQSSAYSYAVGVTVPLPLYNRNQGNIERAKVNIEQTQVQLNALERQVVTEVRQAEREYQTTRDYLARLEASVLPPRGRPSPTPAASSPPAS